MVNFWEEAANRNSAAQKLDIGIGNPLAGLADKLNEWAMTGGSLPQFTTPGSGGPLSVDPVAGIQPGTPVRSRDENIVFTGDAPTGMTYDEYAEKYPQEAEEHVGIPRKKEPVKTFSNIPGRDGYDAYQDVPGYVDEGRLKADRTAEAMKKAPKAKSKTDELYASIEANIKRSPKAEAQTRAAEGRSAFLQHVTGGQGWNRMDETDKKWILSEYNKWVGQLESEQQFEIAREKEILGIRAAKIKADTELAKKKKQEPKDALGSKIAIKGEFLDNMDKMFPPDDSGMRANQEDYDRMVEEGLARIDEVYGSKAQKATPKQAILDEIRKHDPAQVESIAKSIKRSNPDLSPMDIAERVLQQINGQNGVGITRGGAGGGF